GCNLDRPVIGAKQHRVFAGQPERGLHADARTRTDVACVILAVELTPTGVNNHRIAGLQAYVLLLQRAFQIGDGHLIVVAKHLDALEASDVDQHAPRHQRTYVVHAELVEASASGVLVHLETVVPAVAVGLVREAVELGPNLANL